MLLTVNSLFRHTDDNNRIERVVWVSPDRTECFVIDIHNNEYPTLRQVNDLEEGLKGQTYVIEETDPWMRIIDLETQPENEKARFEQAKKIIRLIASNDNEPNIFVSAERGILVRKASAATGMDKSTISRYLKRYWKRGKPFIALYPIMTNVERRGKTVRFKRNWAENEFILRNTKNWLLQTTSSDYSEYRLRNSITLLKDRLYEEHMSK